MPNKKTSSQPSEALDPALEQRVHTIMGDGPQAKPTASTAAQPVSATSTTPPALDIFKDSKTAPEVSADLLKQIGAEQTTDTKPLVTKAVASTSATLPIENNPNAPTEKDVAMTSSEVDSNSIIDDSDTDKAVDEIQIKDSDALLANDSKPDNLTKAIQSKQKPGGRWQRLIRGKWFFLVVFAIVAVIFIVPATRYTILGLVIKRTVSITVTDSTTHTTVSDAVVDIGSQSAKTNAAGNVKLKVSLGKHSLNVSKQYYKTYTKSYFVGFKNGGSASVSLVATGRQVPVSVVNKITGKPIEGATVSVLDTSAKTNQKGQAVIVLPVGTGTDSATITMNGYNTTTATVVVTSSIVSSNTFSITPAGQIYFLSNLSGTIDVVKTNLDGTNRKVVLAGTGKEDPNSTYLLATRDWRYLVLQSQRDSSQPALYIIDTTSDKVTNFDSGNANFSLIGWAGHTLLYDVSRISMPVWQSGREALKSYNADTSQLNQLDQNQAAGNSTSYAYQQFNNYYIINNSVVYNTLWYGINSTGTSYDIANKSDTFRSIQTNGQNLKDNLSIPANGVSYIQSALYLPQEVYYAVYSSSNNATTYYKLLNQTVSLSTDLSQTDLNQTYPIYLASPSGIKTFWSTPRDGKNTLFVGDQNAGQPQQLASLSDYTAFGWYSDGYLLESKGSELYIMANAGSNSTASPLKITDYYKPIQAYGGEGYGYGGQ